MTDRLDEIKRRHEMKHGVMTALYEDVDWLISEIERYRAVPNIEALLSREMVAVDSPKRQEEKLIAEYAKARKDWEVGPDGKVTEP